MQDIGALPHLAAKALAKNFSDIGPVVAYTRGSQEAAPRRWLRDAHPHRFLPEIGLRGSPSNSQEMCHRRLCPVLRP
jgi:hypothetical protein